MACSREAGHPFSLPYVGVVLFSVVIITVHLQLATVVDQWTWLHHVAIWGSTGVCAVCVGGVHACVPVCGGSGTDDSNIQMTKALCLQLPIMAGLVVLLKTQ